MLYIRPDEPPGIWIGGLVILSVIVVVIIVIVIVVIVIFAIVVIIRVTHERFLSVSARRPTGTIARGVNKYPKDFRYDRVIL